MAKSALPDPLSRRHLLEGNLDPAKALVYAQAYLAAGREVEAVDFLAASEPASNAEAQQALSTLREAALERGDVFLMRVTCRALADEPSAATWQSLADAAQRAGRLEDAETAQRLATVGE